MEPFELADKLFPDGFYLQCRRSLFELISEMSVAALPYDSQQCLQMVERAFKPNSQFSTIEKLQLENCIRELALDETVISSADCSRCFGLADIAVQCGRLGIITEHSCFLEVLQDVFELAEEEHCHLIFRYLELRKQDGLFDGLFSTRGNGVILLGLCNELLRKLSPIQHSGIRGRILKFMDSVFPLVDRSGINLKGLSNTDNITEYEGRNEVDDLLKPFADAKTFDQLLNFEEVEKDPSLFYPLFWRLQDLFASGVAVKNLTPTSFATVKKCIDCIVHVIKQVHESEKERSRKFMTISNGNPLNPPPLKYLTDKNLFTLQLRDATFRLTIIIQIILMISNISTELRLLYVKNTVKSKTSDQPAVDGSAASPTKPSFPTNDDRAWVPKIIFSLAQIINQMPNGADYTKALKSITHLEDNWSEWKAKGCHPFSKDATMLPEYERPKPKTFKAKKLCGSDELSRLFSQKPELTAGSNPNLSRPTLDEYLEPLLEQLDPEAGIEEEYLLSNDTEYVWKAFRLASKQYLNEMRDIPNFDLKQLVERIYPKPNNDQVNGSHEESMPVDADCESMEVDSEAVEIGK